MKKCAFFVLALSLCSCVESYVDEQMDAISVVANKGNKTETTVIKSKGNDKKNDKNGIMLIDDMATRSAALYMDDDQIRHPTDGSSNSDKPANGGGSTTTTTKKNSGGFIPKPLK